jgi:hypothetical protein
MTRTVVITCTAGTARNHAGFGAPNAFLAAANRCKLVKNGVSGPPLFTTAKEDSCLSKCP